MQSREKLLQELAALQTRCSELCSELMQSSKQDEEQFERTKWYYRLHFQLGPADFAQSFDSNTEIDEARFNNNNYFKSPERAQEVVDKINLLLKLERLRDIFCPDSGGKYYISYNTESGRYCYGCIMNVPTVHPTSVMFPTEEIALKVCNILNKELEEKT